MKARINLFSIILPRLEVYFLEEWIDHNLSLGVDSIRLYDNGEFPVASKKAYWLQTLKQSQKGRHGKGWYSVEEKLRRETLRVAPKEITWDLKPHLDYSEDTPYEEIKDVLHKLTRKYKQLEVIPWVTGEDHTYGYPTSQLKMMEREAACWRQRENAWLLNIDPDEFIHLKNFNNLKNLIWHYREFNYFSFHPRMGEARKVGVPIKDLKVSSNWAKTPEKWMCNPRMRPLDKVKHAHAVYYRGKKCKSLHGEAFYIHYRVEDIENCGKITKEPKNQ